MVQLCHDSPSTGHPGQRGTQELSRLYWWPGLAAFVSKYVAVCDTCQHYKPTKHPCVVLQPHKVPNSLWQTVGIDLVTGLPVVNGYDAIAVYIDHYSKQVHVIPTTSEVDADGMADIHY